MNVKNALVRYFAGAGISLIAGMLAGVGTALAAATQFETFEKPYSADSPWNVRPLDPQLGTASVPTDIYYPVISGGAYSTNFVEAVASDPARTIYATDGNTINLVYGTATSLSFPHWPASAIPASGTDGHLDIYDATTGIIHSFWQLRTMTSGSHAGELTATQYNWSLIDERGWGNPALFYQGARAVGVPPSAGIIRTQEINDGQETYSHALAMSLTYSGLSANPTFEFPANAADYDAASTNYGAIPEGALLMLPSSFDETQITSAKLLKIVKTLKTYGARVVDRNVGTPYAIYVEGTTDTFQLCASYPDYTNGWSNTCAQQLQLIRAGLHPLVNQAGWVDGHGIYHHQLDQKLRMVAGRGYPSSTNLSACSYDIVNDRDVVVSAAQGTNTCSLDETIPTGITPTWTGNKRYEFSVQASSPDIKASLTLFSANGNVTSSLIGNRQKTTLTAPANVWALSRVTISLPDNTRGWIHVSAVPQ